MINTEQIKLPVVTEITITELVLLRSYMKKAESILTFNEGKCTKLITEFSKSCDRD